MRWIRLLVYEGPVKYIRAAQSRSLPDGTRVWSSNHSIRVVSILGGRWRAIWQILREVLHHE